MDDQCDKVMGPLGIYQAALQVWLVMSGQTDQSSSEFNIPNIHFMYETFNYNKWIPFCAT